MSGGFGRLRPDVAAEYESSVDAADEPGIEIVSVDQEETATTDDRAVTLAAQDVNDNLDDENPFAAFERDSSDSPPAGARSQRPRSSVTYDDPEVARLNDLLIGSSGGVPVIENTVPVTNPVSLSIDLGEESRPTAAVAGLGSTTPWNPGGGSSAPSGVVQGSTVPGPGAGHTGVSAVTVVYPRADGEPANASGIPPSFSSAQAFPSADAPFDFSSAETEGTPFIGQPSRTTVPELEYNPWDGRPLADRLDEATPAAAENVNTSNLDDTATEESESRLSRLLSLPVAQTREVSSDPNTDPGSPFDVGTDEAATSLADRSKLLRDGISRLGARIGLGNRAQEPRLNVTQQTDPASAAIEAMIALLENELSGFALEDLQADELRADYIRKHVHLRLMYLMADQHERTLDAIPGLKPSEQEFWQQLFWSLSQYFDGTDSDDRPIRIARTVDRLRAAIDSLQEDARLEVRNLNFCRNIPGFGNYERFERNEFTPGQPSLVYVEIRNFRSQPTVEGHYRTVLKSRIEIIRADSPDKVEFSRRFAGTEDLCQSQRHDYFHSYELTMPQRLQPGAHTLRLTVEDVLTGRRSVGTINFTVR